MVADIQQIMEQIAQIQGREIGDILVPSTSCLFHFSVADPLE